MTTHLSDEQIRAYRERSLAAAELLEASRHIGGCEACWARVAPPAEMAARIQAIQAALEKTESAHLSYEELEAYVDGTMDAGNRAALEAHTGGCRPCADDLAAIESVRRELQAPVSSRAPGARWAGFWSALMGWRGGLALAAAASAVVAVVLVRAPAPRPGDLSQARPSPRRPAAAGSVIRDGTRVITVARDGSIDGLTQLTGTDRTIVQQALAQRRVEPSAALADLTAKPGVLLGAPGEPPRGRLLEPLGAMVETQTPVFRWQPVTGATYRVSVYDSSYRMVAESGSLSAAEWQVRKPLPRGMRFSWQLTVRQSGAEFTIPAPPAPEARFRVLGEEEEARMAQARSAWGDSHLILGVLYARAGLLDQAEQELTALRRQNPSSQDVANLLESVERLRRGNR